MLINLIERTRAERSRATWAQCSKSGKRNSVIVRSVDRSVGKLRNQENQGTCSEFRGDCIAVTKLVPVTLCVSALLTALAALSLDAGSGSGSGSLATCNVEDAEGDVLAAGGRVSCCCCCCCLLSGLGSGSGGGSLPVLSSVRSLSGSLSLSWSVVVDLRIVLGSGSVSVSVSVSGSGSAAPPFSSTAAADGRLGLSSTAFSRSSKGRAGSGSDPGSCSWRCWRLRMARRASRTRITRPKMRMSAASTPPTMGPVEAGVVLGSSLFSDSDIEEGAS